MSLKTRALTAAGLLLVLLVAYGRAITFDELVYDGRQLVRNPVVQGGWDPRALMTTDSWGNAREGSHGSYRPFSTAALWLEHRLWGSMPSGYYVVQLAWMLAVCLLVIALSRALSVSVLGSVLAGLLFAAHPVHTDNVASLAGRADLMAAAIFLLAMITHRRVGAGWRLLTVLLVILGLGTKEFFSVFVLAAMGVDLLGPPRPGLGEGGLAIRERLSRLPWVLYLLYAACTVSFFWARHVVTGVFVSFPYGFVDNPLCVEPTAIRWLNTPGLLVRYAQLLVAPINLSPDRSYHAVPVIHSLLSFHLWAGLALLLLLAAALVRWRHDATVRGLAVLAAILYLPLSNLLKASTSTMADRWLFMVSVPFCIGAGAGFALLWRRFLRIRRFVAVAGIIYLAALIAIAHDYTAHWRSDFSLFAYAAETTPTNVKARFIHGKELQRRGRLGEALVELQAAATIWPDCDQCTLAVAEVHESMGQLRKAEQVLRDTARRLGKRQPIGLIRLSAFLRRRGRQVEADALQRTIRRDYPWLDDYAKNRDRVRRAYVGDEVVR